MVPSYLERHHLSMESLAVQPDPPVYRNRPLTGSWMPWIRALAIGSAVACAATAAIVEATGPAQAASSPNVVGQKYSAAQGTLTSAGYTAIVSTTVGDKVARSDCLVTNQVDQSVPPPENTAASATNQTLLSLNCEAPLASAKSAGNSLGSPAGQAAASSAAAAASSSAAAAASASPSAAPAH
jgi:hypothetical protein